MTAIVAVTVTATTAALMTAYKVITSFVWGQKQYYENKKQKCI